MRFQVIAVLSFFVIFTRSINASSCSSSGSDFYVEIYTSSQSLQISTAGCPQYDWTDQSTPNTAVVQYTTYSVPANPKICKTPTAYVGAYVDKSKTRMNYDPSMGPIGVAFNGVAIFSNVDAKREDAYLNEGHTFDKCNGHPNQMGQYHYHSEIPQECLKVPERNDEHSALFGVMADGVPIFGPLGDDGLIPSDLDECNGHVDESYPFYHYHVEPYMRYPYTVNCLKGEIDRTKWRNFRNAQSCNPSEQQYDYSDVSSIWNEILSGSQH